MSPIDTLISVMARLRDPESGCPWDVEQDFRSIAPHTIEEAYEVADAIEHGDLDHLKEELGDLLLQIVFHARMAEEQGAFDFGDVATGIAEKLIHRHPHVFGDQAADTAGDVMVLWENNKAAERQRKAEAAGRTPSVLDDIAVSLPALTRAVKIQKRMARIGFDWQSIDSVFDKLDEEINELKVEIAAGNQTLIAEEFGDVLFVMANIARHLDIDPETALRHANAKVERRFRHVETSVGGGQSSLTEMEEFWQQAKALEKTPASS